MRWRLILSFVSIVLVAVVGVVLIAQHGAASEVRMFMSRGGMARLDTLVEELEAHYEDRGSWDEAEGLLVSFAGNLAGGQGNRPDHAGQGMMAGMMNQDLILADENGKIVAVTGSAAEGQLNRSELEQAIQLRSGLHTVGYLVVRGGMAFSQVDERFLVGRLTRAALVGGLVAGGLALLLALALAYRLNQPIQALIQAARSLSRGDLNQRVAVTGKDELAELGQAFNQMASSLQQTQESRRAMTADIAHELRNPLAVQRANLEALQDGIYELTPNNLQPILEQNHLLTRLVEDLRILALADAGQLKLEYSWISLSTLVERVLERFKAQAEPRGVSFVLEAAPDCPEIQIDSRRIEQVLVNLISNALRYAPGPGRIEIKITCSPESVILTLHDNGPGIPEEALAHVFERFYRADRSRSRIEGGSGLGLAIARQLVEAHGGELKAANHPEGGALFTLKLPREQVKTQA
jgi:two-component system, OmpR family, sensor histidine kinase BaeS